jgi:hypothetical protein
MSYKPQKFAVLSNSAPPSNDGDTSGKPFYACSQKAIELLEGITPAEKAQAVPYVTMWEIDPSTGKAMHANSDGSPRHPLNMTWVEPPKFGRSLSSANERFRDRPPVSLEKISVKVANPRGIILYRTLEITFVVHRPDVVFDQHIRSDGSHVGDEDSWSSLITPGQAFALEYGWSASTGVSNGLLNGEGFVDRSKGIAVQGREQVRFYVTSYKFNLQTDSQIRFAIQAYELGESGLRQAFLVRDPNATTTITKAGKLVEIDPYADGGSPVKALLNKFHDEVSSSGKLSKKKGVVDIPFGMVIDVIFADAIKDSFTSLGFDFKEMFVGCLNGRAGKPAPKYSAGADVSNKPISDFTFPLDDVEKVFRDLMKAGSRLTVYNFIEPFLRLFSKEYVWDRKGEDNNSNRSIPELIMKSVSRRNRSGKMEVYYYIFDTKSEFVKFSPDDAQKLPSEIVSRNDIKKAVNDKGVPFVSLVKGNSFVQDTSFEVIQDEQMAGIFMRRYFGDKSVNRSEKVTSPDAAWKEDRAPAVQQIFSPTIQGQIITIGNFVLDTFGLIWLDFGISRWDGPFTLYEKEDVIQRGSFVTNYKVFSSCTDPLGTKSRKDF